MSLDTSFLVLQFCTCFSICRCHVVPSTSSSVLFYILNHDSYTFLRQWLSLYISVLCFCWFESGFRAIGWICNILFFLYGEMFFNWFGLNISLQVLCINILFNPFMVYCMTELAHILCSLLLAFDGIFSVVCK